MLFNEKGQAFDVFKLLIAAVVAVVILTLLLSIIGGIGIIGQGDPSKEAQTMIKDLVTKKGSVGTSPKVTFSTDTSINRRGIALASGGIVDAEGVCVLPGDFYLNPNWETDNTYGGVSVKYIGSTPVVVKEKAICDICSDMVSTDYYPTYLDNVVDESQFGDCGDASELFSNGSTVDTCCVVILKRTT